MKKFQAFKLTRKEMKSVLGGGDKNMEVRLCKSTCSANCVVDNESSFEDGSELAYEQVEKNCNTFCEGYCGSGA